MANWLFLSIWRKKVWQINRSANRLLTVNTNLDGFSLANHGLFTKFANFCPTFPPPNFPAILLTIINTPHVSKMLWTVRFLFTVAHAMDKTYPKLEWLVSHILSFSQSIHMTYEMFTGYCPMWGSLRLTPVFPSAWIDQIKGLPSSYLAK